MIDVVELESVMRRPSNPEDRLKISCIGIITCNRPLELERCLRSYAEHLRHHERQCDFAVMDDSDDAAGRETCREWLRSFARASRIKVSYSGREERLNYGCQLASLGIPHELTAFILGNPLGIPASPGANRNALLLHAAGEAFLSCDDDSICHVADLRRGRQLVYTVPFCNMLEHIRFVPHGQSSSQVVPESACDVMAMHEALLGRALCDLPLPLQNTARVSVGKMGGRVLSNLIEGSGRARITISGVLGDCGMPAGSGLMMLTGEARIRFLQSYESTGIPEVVLGVSRPTLSLTGPVMTSTATGFDNRVLLPPFTPSGRGEDTFFGVLLAKCLPDAYFGYVPIALLHAPGRSRTYDPLPAAPKFVNLLASILEGCPDVPASSPAERIRAVGNYLQECGRVHVREFEAHFLRSTRSWLALLLENAERLLNSHGAAPTRWAREMQQWIRRIECNLITPENLFPVDLADSGLPEERYAAIQRFLERFGEVLRCWPEIIAAARRLAENGHRIAGPLA